jgi:hypothetical protein
MNYKNFSNSGTLLGNVQQERENGYCITITLSPTEGPNDFAREKHSSTLNGVEAISVLYSLAKTITICVYLF